VIPIPHACVLLCALSSVSVHGHTVTLHAGRDVLVVQAAESNLLHVHYEPNGLVSTPTDVLDRRRVWPSDTPTTIDVRSDPIVVRTAQMIVKVSRRPVRVEIDDAAGKALLREPAARGVQPHGVKFVVNGSHLFFGIDGFSLPGSNIDARQDVRSGLVRQGGLVRANQGDGAAPLVYTNHYGLLVDSDGGNFTIADDMLRVIAGPPGAAPMSPKWTLGFLNSQWGTTQAQVERYVADGASGVFAKRIAAEGVKLTGIFKPRILLYNSSGKFDEAATLARAWYWQHTKPAYESGIVGFWNDEADAMSDGALFNNFQFLNPARRGVRVEITR